MWPPLGVKRRWHRQRPVRRRAPQLDLQIALPLQAIGSAWAAETVQAARTGSADEKEIARKGGGRPRLHVDAEGVAAASPPTAAAISPLAAATPNTRR
ncbi:MAG: hypothetical protein COX57_09050 [Alphaproteobacteria bacterium CG_4_10_14_0_2_um_filter_63_37]|nr:MAG: hypothetical protein AUJ55_11475 [Proteobacteria bacterium CG1_02_64_396]PJA24350.1 MAG: hypothetical protein COX57_09050 [Alphaproteobacteria bacterium CG_4_10_14_0_2_um_filter_63_37]